MAACSASVEKVTSSLSCMRFYTRRTCTVSDAVVVRHFVYFIFNMSIVCSSEKYVLDSNAGGPLLVNNLQNHFFGFILNIQNFHSRWYIYILQHGQFVCKISEDK